MADNTDPEEVLKYIKQLNVEPLYPLVARLLSCPPTAEAIQVYSNKYPDKYWQAVTMAMRLIGFNKDAPGTQNNYFMVIQGMSDSELRQLNEKLEGERRALMEKTVEGEIEDGTNTKDH